MSKFEPFHSLRLRLAAWLIGKSPVIANMKIQFMEASTINGRTCAMFGVTIGKVTETEGMVAIGRGALRYHIGTGKTAGVPLCDVHQDHPDLQWLLAESPDQQNRIVN